MITEFSFLNSSSLLAFIIGIAATVLTRYSSIPQIIKGFKTKRMDDVSFWLIFYLTVGLFLYVDDVDKVFSQAVTEGAKVLMGVEDQFWGDRYGSIEDPFGHIWSISTHIKDLTEEELKKAAEESFAKMPENKPN